MTKLLKLIYINEIVYLLVFNEPVKLSTKSAIKFTDEHKMVTFI